MKMFAVVMLSVLTIPSYAQGILGALEKHQSEIVPKTNSTNSNATEVKPEPVVKTKSSGDFYYYFVSSLCIDLLYSLFFLYVV
jgi:hypothetical protein